MTVTLNPKELNPKLDRLFDLMRQWDPVTQQKLLELMIVRHVLGTHTLEDARYVTAAMNKHAKQILAQGHADPDLLQFNLDDANFIADGLHRHVDLLLESYWQDQRSGKRR